MHPSHVSKHADSGWCAGCEACLTIDANHCNGDGLVGLLAVEYILPLMQFNAMEMVSWVCWLKSMPYH